MPSVLLTDQGRNIESNVSQSICHLLHINKRRTTPYHPQSDGLCERLNGILQLLLRMKVNKDREPGPDHDNWDALLLSPPFGGIVLECHTSRLTSMKRGRRRK